LLKEPMNTSPLATDGEDSITVAVPVQSGVQALGVPEQLVVSCASNA